MGTAKLTIRIDREELVLLQQVAAQDKRSINQQVLYYIRQALEKRSQ